MRAVALQQGHAGVGAVLPELARVSEDYWRGWDTAREHDAWELRTPVIRHKVTPDFTLGYVAYRSKKLGKNPYTNEIFVGTRDYELAIARREDAPQGSDPAPTMKGASPTA